MYVASTAVAGFFPSPKQDERDKRKPGCREARESCCTKWKAFVLFFLFFWLRVFPSLTERRESFRQTRSLSLSLSSHYRQGLFPRSIFTHRHFSSQMYRDCALKIPPALFLPAAWFRFKNFIASPTPFRSFLILLYFPSSIPLSHHQSIRFSRTRKKNPW